MALSSQAIADKVILVLQDQGFVRWTKPDLAKWINLACRMLVRLKPGVLVTSAALLLTAGTKQTLVGASFKKTVDGAALAITALELLGVVRNLGSTGTEAAAGKPITLMQRQTLDVALPGWHSQAAGTEIKYLLPDLLDRKTFHVYPKATASPAMYIEVEVTRLPVNSLQDSASAFASNDLDAGIDDIYEDVLVDLVLGLAFRLDGENASYAALSWRYLSGAMAALGVRVPREKILAAASEAAGAEAV